MRLARITALLIIAAALTGCAGNPANRPTPTPTPTPSDDLTMNSTGLPSLSPAEVCQLLLPAEAERLLGHPLNQAPIGTSVSGGHVTCLYQVLAGNMIGDYLRAEIDTAGFDGLAAQVNLHRGAHTLDVGGYQAFGAEAQIDPIDSEAVLAVKLARDNADPALWIEAPTSAIANAAAQLILPRLAAKAPPEPS